MQFKDTIEELLRLQDKTNTGTIGKDWNREKNKWGITIITELAEAIESSPYKWWKKGELDLDNIKVEIIDMLHFSMSLDMTRMDIPFLALHIREPEWKYTEDGFDQDRFIEYCEDVISSVGMTYLSSNAEIVTNNILKLAEGVGMDLKEVRNRYIGKNALNLLRQQRGYKDGVYKKIWGDDEDNVWIANYINENQTASFDRILADAKEHYDLIVS